MIRALLIEGDPAERKALVEMIESLQSDLVVHGFTDSIQATVEWLINNPSPHLIFLAAELPDGPGMALFQETRIVSPVIFMAPDARYALKAFKYYTIDYLLKPIRKNSIISALYKYQSLKEVMSLESGSPPLALPEVKKDREMGPLYRTRYAVHLGDRLKVVECREISYFMADGNIIFLITNLNDRYTINYRLEEIMAHLNPLIFFRINRTFIVQIDAIKETRKYFNGRLKVFLSPDPSDEEVFVSRNRVPEFLKWLGE